MSFQLSSQDAFSIHWLIDISCWITDLSFIKVLDFTIILRTVFMFSHLNYLWLIFAISFYVEKIGTIKNPDQGSQIRLALIEDWTPVSQISASWWQSHDKCLVRGKWYSSGSNLKSQILCQLTFFLYVLKATNRKDV